MKEKEEDIKDISHVLEFFNRTTKALDVMKEQHKKDAYMLICVETVNVDGEERQLSHVAHGRQLQHLKESGFPRLERR